MALRKKQREWLENNGSYDGNYANVPEELSTEEFWHEAVRKNIWALRYVPEKWKTIDLFLEVMRYTVFSKYGRSQYGYDLNRVPEELRTETACLAAMQAQGGMALKFIPDAQKTEIIRKYHIHDTEE